MKKLILIYFLFSVVSAKSQNLFGFDPYDSLKTFVKKFNIEICTNQNFKEKSTYTADSLFYVKMKSIKSKCSLIAYSQDKMNLNTSTKGNLFTIDIFEMNFKGKFDPVNNEIIEFVAKSKGIKYRVTKTYKGFELTPLKFKEKSGNEKQIEELKKNLPTIVSFVKNFIVLPQEYCK